MPLVTSRCQKHRFQPVSIMMRIETRNRHHWWQSTALPARIHYDEDWNLMMDISPAVLLLPARIHYDEDWNYKPSPHLHSLSTSSPYPLWWGLKLFTNLNSKCLAGLPARIHYDEDWNLRKSLCRGAHPLPARSHYDEDWNSVIAVRTSWAGSFQPVSIMMRIETHSSYNVDYFRLSSSPYPLWWGLKLVGSTVKFPGFRFFQPVSIMMRIETGGNRGLIRELESSSPYPLWWGLKLENQLVYAMRSSLPARIHYDEDWNF